MSVQFFTSAAFVLLWTSFVSGDEIANATSPANNSLSPMSLGSFAPTASPTFYNIEEVNLELRFGNQLFSSSDTAEPLESDKATFEWLTLDYLRSQGLDVEYVRLDEQYNANKHAISHHVVRLHSNTNKSDTIKKNATDERLPQMWIAQIAVGVILLHENDDMARRVKPTLRRMWPLYVSFLTSHLPVASDIDDTASKSPISILSRREMARMVGAILTSVAALISVLLLRRRVRMQRNRYRQNKRKAQRDIQKKVVDIHSPSDTSEEDHGNSANRENDDCDSSESSISSTSNV